METYNNNDSEIFSLQVDEVARANMLETARWGKFIAIIGFIFLGIILLAGVAMLFSTPFLDSIAGGAMGVGMSFFYFIMAAFYFYPTYALYKFSQLIKPAIATGNQAQFNQALGYLKSLFKFIGIISIVIIALYGIVFLFIGIGAAVGGA